MTSTTLRSHLRVALGHTGAYREMNTLLEQVEGVGNRFFVDSGIGADAGGRGSLDMPFDTLAYAISQCTANSGDVIYLLPGHAETVGASDITLSKAGITIIGLGVWSERPTFTFSATGSTIKVTAANNYVRGINCVSAIDSLVTFLDLDEGNFICEDCEFTTSSTFEAVCFVDIATTKDNFIFRNCTFTQPTDPAGTDAAAGTGCFYFVDTEGILIEDCKFWGNFESAIFHNKTTAAKKVIIRNCHGAQLLAGAEVGIQVTDMEGYAVNCYFTVYGSADVAEANTWGTLSAKFFVDINSSVGNDGGGGQLAVVGATAAS